MNAPKHTPTPWHVGSPWHTDEIWIGSTEHDIQRIALCRDLGTFEGTERDEANAALIVHAVNSYSERHLVLQEALAYFSDVAADDALGHALFKRIEKLLHPPVANMLADQTPKQKKGGVAQG